MSYSSQTENKTKKTKRRHKNVWTRLPTLTLCIIHHDMSRRKVSVMICLDEMTAASWIEQRYYHNVMKAVRQVTFAPKDITGFSVQRLGCLVNCSTTKTCISRHARREEPALRRCWIDKKATNFCAKIMDKWRPKILVLIFKYRLRISTASMHWIYRWKWLYIGAGHW